MQDLFENNELEKQIHMFTMLNVFKNFQRWSKVCVIVDFFLDITSKRVRFFNNCY